ncbi:hypothetical protein [Mesorhizobium sp.]|uniref:hypothetical protein n=1 Tax=Mesorhizobium sp. TaxID=1871066 RepID=UPI000FE2A5D6|nr:hypothetical protein [Mesorhizobium sp.]RWQ17649.1 MAG: hypothetical protein EOR92_18840 [Mesorhizobium sp.]
MDCAQASAMSRRHGLSNPLLLLGARRMAREANLASAVLVPAMIVPDQRKKPEPAGRRIEVVSVHGRRVTIEPEIDVEASFRIMRSENAAMIPIATGAGVAGDRTHRNALRLPQPCSTRGEDLHEGWVSGDMQRREHSPLACASWMAGRQCQRRGEWPISFLGLDPFLKPVRRKAVRSYIDRGTQCTVRRLTPSPDYHAVELTPETTPRAQSRM